MTGNLEVASSNLALGTGQCECPAYHLTLPFGKKLCRECGQPGIPLVLAPAGRRKADVLTESTECQQGGARVHLDDPYAEGSELSSQPHPPSRQRAHGPPNWKNAQAARDQLPLNFPQAPFAWKRERRIKRDERGPCGRRPCNYLPVGVERGALHPPAQQAGCGRIFLFRRQVYAREHEIF